LVGAVGAVPSYEVIALTFPVNANTSDAVTIHLEKRALRNVIL
jgi:hypothetical protein